MSKRRPARERRAPSKAQLRLLADAVYLYRGRLNASDYRADCGAVVLRSTLEALLSTGLVTLDLGSTDAPGYCILRVTDAGREACRELVLEMEAREKKRAEKIFGLDDAASGEVYTGPSPAPEPVPVPPSRKTHTDHLLEVAGLLGVPREPWATLGERVGQAATAAALDALRWRKVVGCGRVRILGHSQLGQPDAHIGLELWGVYPNHPDRGGAEVLEKFADGLEERG